MEGLLHYINPAHSISLLSALNEERLKGQLCDVLLIVGDQKFRAHKNVLAASSEYFQSLFTNKENEAQTVFQLDFCEPDAFDNVLNYIYSSSLFVEKGSLAAVQELGYSLGISFLTNIVAKAPQAPFLACPNRKRVPVDDDESGSQKRSVIVCQSRNEAQGKAISPRAPSPSVTAKSSAVGPPHVATSADPLHGGLSLAESGWPRDGAAVYAKRLSHAGSLDESRSSAVSRSAAGPVTTPPDREAGDNVPGASGQLPKGKAIELALKRPRPPVLALRSSSETPYVLKETSKGGGQGEDRNLLYYSTLGLVIPSSGPASARPAIDRSGPLVKSLLRRSLSMDSQVPVHSPSIDLKASQGSSAPPSDAPGKASSPKSSLKDGCEQAAPDDEPQVPPPRLRSLSASQSLDREVASPVRVKTEPSSPPAEPSDIIRVTVVDTAVTTSDVPLKVEEDQTDVSRLPAKRRFQADRRSPFKKARVDEQGLPASEDAREDGPSPPLDGHLPDSDLIKEEFGELAGPRPNRKFKCKHCLKIFRSTAGLHRHVNMYHNPEKPYACDICHKRFHTNFKVWTHCQTQHGVVKNPSPASGSHAVLDERFQRKLIDIVREREIKKALVGKLRRSRPGFPGPAGYPAAAAAQQAIKRNLRSRAKGTYLCACCGKACRLLSQLKQHMRTHLGERGAGAGAGPRARAEAAGAGQGAGSRSQEVYPCRLCNAELSSLLEQGSHERLCRSAAVCPFCSLRFFSPALRREHEPRCEYRRLTCLECMRTFKSAFSIWRHQVEVHHQNSMAPPPPAPAPAPLNGEAPRAAATEPVAPREDGVASDSEDSCLPEDLSMARPPPPRVKEEPEEPEEAAAPREPAPQPRGPDSNLWPCEKCGKAFPAPRQLERHQELLCSVKPFICHVCHKAFRTNFRLWSHFQSHMAPADEPEGPAPAPAASPSPPPLPPPPPLPQIQPLEPDGPAGPDGPAANPDKLSDTLFYHAPPLSAITFKRQFMCKLCHRTFKTAFSLWSHEQTHN